MIGRDHYQIEETEFGDSARQRKSLNYESLTDHNLDSNSKSRENEIRRFAEVASSIRSDNYLTYL